MSFIDDFEAIPPADAGARVGLFFQALAVDWAGLFADLRQRRPILDIGAFLVVSRWADVIDILSRPGTFRVPYQPHMDDSVGPYMLGRDETELNWHDKSLMRALMRWDDLPGIRAFARSTAEGAVADAGETLDVVAKVSRLVPLRVVQQSFGFPGPDDTSMLRWSKATQADMFHNLVNDPAVLAANNAAGTEMRAWLRTWLAGRRPWCEAKGEDVVSRLLRATDAGLSAFEEEEVVSNICGLLVGAVETTSQAIVNATEQILLRPDVTARAIAAAQADDMEAFDAIVWEALRFNPMGSLVVRVAAEDSVLAPGSEHETKVSGGPRDPGRHRLGDVRSGRVPGARRVPRAAAQQLYPHRLRPARMPRPVRRLCDHPGGGARDHAAAGRASAGRRAEQGRQWRRAVRRTLRRRRKKKRRRACDRRRPRSAATPAAMASATRSRITCSAISAACGASSTSGRSCARSSTASSSTMSRARRRRAPWRWRRRRLMSPGRR